MSNQIGMKREFARDEVAGSRVRKAWHVARNRKVTKKTNEDGTISRIVSMSPGLSRKAWARLQVKDKSSMATECELWLTNKSGVLEKDAKGLKMKERGGMLAQIAAATKLSHKSKKKGAGGSAKQDTKSAVK